MSLRTLSDTLIRLEAFKIIFVFRPKMEFFPREKMVFFHGFWPKMNKFKSHHFSLVYVPKDLGMSKNSLGNHF